MTPEQRAFIKAAVAYADWRKNRTKENEWYRLVKSFDDTFKALGPDGVEELLEEKTCKWRSELTGLHTSCGEIIDDYCDYCPHCGGKVEVVR